MWFLFPCTWAKSIGVWPSSTCEKNRSNTTIRWVTLIHECSRPWSNIWKMSRSTRERLLSTQPDGKMSASRIVRVRWMAAIAVCLAVCLQSLLLEVHRLHLVSSTCHISETKWFWKFQREKCCCKKEISGLSNIFHQKFTVFPKINFCVLLLFDFFKIYKKLHQKNNLFYTVKSNIYFYIRLDF